MSSTETILCPAFGTLAVFPRAVRKAGRRVLVSKQDSSSTPTISESQSAVPSSRDTEPSSSESQPVTSPQDTKRMTDVATENELSTTHNYVLKRPQDSRQRQRRRPAPLTITKPTDKKAAEPEEAQPQKCINYFHPAPISCGAASISRYNRAFRRWKSRTHARWVRDVQDEMRNLQAEGFEYDHRREYFLRREAVNRLKQNKQKGPRKRSTRPDEPNDDNEDSNGEFVYSWESRELRLAAIKFKPTDFQIETQMQGCLGCQAKKMRCSFEHKFVRRTEQNGPLLEAPSANVPAGETRCQRCARNGCRWCVRVAHDPLELAAAVGFPQEELGMNGLRSVGAAARQMGLLNGDCSTQSLISTSGKNAASAAVAHRPAATVLIANLKKKPLVGYVHQQGLSVEELEAMIREAVVEMEDKAIFAFPPWTDFDKNDEHHLGKDGGGDAQSRIASVRNGGIGMATDKARDAQEYFEHRRWKKDRGKAPQSARACNRSTEQDDDRCWGRESWL